MSDVVKYAKRNNDFLFVTIKDNDRKKEFRLTVKRYAQMVKNYCAWYETGIKFHYCDDYEDTIRLSNGIEFNAIIY